MGDNRSGLFISGIDIIDLENLIKKKNRKFIALTLQEIEERPDNFRKAIMDGFNDYTRSLLRAIIGDTEDGNTWETPLESPDSFRKDSEFWPSKPKEVPTMLQKSLTTSGKQPLQTP